MEGGQPPELEENNNPFAVPEFAGINFDRNQMMSTCQICNLQMPDSELDDHLVAHTMMNRQDSESQQ